jgi:molybdopterin synthase sulfur carrier subunit
MISIVHGQGRLFMITVKVRTILTLKQILGKGEIEISVPEKSTLGELLTMMVEGWGGELGSNLFEPKSKSIRPYIRLMVNGRDIAFLNRMETVLQNGDEILILPPVSGG